MQNYQSFTFVKHNSLGFKSDRPSVITVCRDFFYGFLKCDHLYPFRFEHNLVVFLRYVFFVTHGIIEKGYSKITLILRLSYMLENSLVSVKHREGGCPEGECT